MTRINVVPVGELTDNFILAEFFELPRLWPLIHKTMSKHKGVVPVDLPPTYRLGLGHVRFFYDKILYLSKRHEELFREGSRRGLRRPALGVDPTVDKTLEDVRLLSAIIYTSSGVDTSLWFNDYWPEEQDLQLNRNRLEYRRRYDGGSYRGSR